MTKEEREARWASGEGYDRYIQAEFASFRKEAWTRQILDHFPGKEQLKILDVGTGPGFFACILSLQGHHVTGIDTSAGMLEKAAKNAAAFGVHPKLVNMDVNALAFDDESFDVIVTRNVTWTLEQPDMVYAELKRVLKTGGTLLIYDANWHLQFFRPQIRAKVLQHEKEYEERYGRREIVASEDPAYYKTTPLASIERPAWDIETLTNLGMEVSVTEDIGRWLYEQWEKDLYQESPLFEICARRSEKGQIAQNMHNYWQDRASSFGFTRDDAQRKKIQASFAKYLPEGRLKILDIGTGTGSIGISLALLGHQVTCADLCSNMLEKVRENARESGVTVSTCCCGADELPFADDTFDAVVCRNLIWALPEPEKALAQWKRVLKRGGRLIYNDANHYYYLFNAQDQRNRELLTELAGSPRGSHPETYDTSLCDSTALDLPLSKLNRPYQWDHAILPRMGFCLLAEEIYCPQAKMPFGEYDSYEGYYTQFLIAAINSK